MGGDDGPLPSPLHVAHGDLRGADLDRQYIDWFDTVEDYTPGSDLPEPPEPTFVYYYAHAVAFMFLIVGLMLLFGGLYLPPEPKTI